MQQLGPSGVYVGTWCISSRVSEAPLVMSVSYERRGGAGRGLEEVL